MGAEDGGAVIKLEEQAEGELYATLNYRYRMIGEPVPILNSNFDPECLPIQPLAVSERFRLLFVAHPHGFCVTRTKDVMQSAEEIKEKKSAPSVVEFSLVDVPIGKILILALSVDDSSLAAIVDSHVHFFAVSALLHKEREPSYSVSLDESGSIKDMRWAKKDAKTYLILSTNGKLYRGSGQGPLSCVMESVNSVDWSVEGNFVVVARNNNLCILSSQFKEKMSFLLPFESLDSDANQVIKVDSVRWFRPDCIAVGCFELNEDGEEENYVVQLVTSRGQRITGASSKPILLSFNSVFLDFRPDAVSARNGPHLFLNYLDPFGVAFIANRNLSQHVGLFSWSRDTGNNEATLVDILNDHWWFHINEFQDNGEENVILGLCVDKVAQNENAKFTLGDGVEVEVSPCCVIACVTIDGKISVFHFASAVGTSSLPEFSVSYEQDDDTQVSTEHELSQISFGSGEGSTERTVMKSESHELIRSELGKSGAKDTSTNDMPLFFRANLGSEEQTASKNMGHKPIENFQKLEADEPGKSLSMLPIQDSSASKQSIFEVKSSPCLFSAKQIGDLSNQSMANSPLLGHRVEPLGKVPSIDLPGAQSSTWSNDALRTAGRFLSPPDPVDSSDKRALQYAERVLRYPTDAKDKIKSSLAFSAVGQTTSTAQGNRQSVPSYPVQTHLDGCVSSEKSLNSELKKESIAVSSPTGFQHSAQNAPKQFGNVEEMAKKLDKLLEGIQGKGGFVDACITSHENAVVGLEDGMQALSETCRMLRGLLDDQSSEVQFLLDKTIQVLARKVYMEGIFKQATDSRYWELWNRQKLSSELELKRKCILDINQELTNQLIELERHFNALELNRFGEDGGLQKNRTASRSWSGNSRQIKSLHSLHNTMTAQLAAAEQLSGCLSEQMSTLSIDSSAKHDAKKKLFESIGLSYTGDSHRSLGRDNTYSTPSNKRQLITSYSAATKEHSGRNQVTNAKNSEAETARRCRGSLDQSWATFEPPKTTVSRMLVKDVEKGSASRKMINIDSQYLTPQTQKKSEVAQAAVWNASGSSSNRNKSNGSVEVAVKQSYERVSTLLSQRRDNSIQGSSTLSFPALPAQSIIKTSMTPNSELGAFRLTDEKSKNNVPFSGNSDSFAGSKSKFYQQSTNSFQLVSTSTWLPEQSLTPTCYSTEGSGHSKLGYSTTGNQMNTQTGTERASSQLKLPVTSSAFSSALNTSEKGIFIKGFQETTQTVDIVPASTPLQSVFGSSSNSSTNVPSFSAFVSKDSKPSSQILFPALSSSDASVASKKDLSQSQAPSTQSFSSTFSLSTPQTNLSSVSPSSIIAKSESLTVGSESLVSVHGSKTEQNSQSLDSVANVPSTAEKDLKIHASAPKPLSIVAPGLNLGFSASPTSAEMLTISNPGTQVDLSNTSKPTSIFTPVTKSEQPASAEATSPITQSSSLLFGNLKNVLSDESPEEEMEEEAPETNQTTEFTLENLGGFGIGSTPNSTTARPNPFGVTALNKDTTSPTSTFVMPSPNGELFRPASFNFQSPQPLQSTAVSLSGGFGTGNPGQVSGGSGFGQPALMGVGQQALGSVLGTFGQSRQVGAGLPGSNAASPSGFGGGFGGISAGGFGGGFSSAATGGGFASLATSGGGFAAAATSGGGFAAAATSGGGFAAATGPGAAVSGGGFGAFNQQGGGGGGFSAFGGGSGATRPPSDLFTQMRR